MKNTAVYRLVLFIYRFLSRMYFGVLRRLENKTDRLLFVFGGRSEGWPGLGRSLYKEYPEFAATIQYCNSVLVELGGAEILSYFEGSVNEQYFADESKFTCITAIQIATVKLYNDRGFSPNAVMGVSMGESGAAFAAGALTAEEALKVAASYMAIHKEAGVQYVFLILNLNITAANQLCNDLPVWIEVIYEDSPHAVLIACHKKDIDQLQHVLNAHRLSFKLLSDKSHAPYHTSLIRKQSKLLREYYKDFEPKPLKCDYYSPTLGKMIPKNTLLAPDYWYNLACVPVLFASALQAAVNDGYKILLQVGPAAISERQFINIVPNAEIADRHTFQKGSDEVSHHLLITKQLKRLKFEKTSINKTGLLNGFKQQFDINASSGMFGYEYLRKNGSMHFLPVHNAWIVLNYEDVDQVLKQPEVFSSSLLKDFDPILLGADPELHKVIRDLLHPLFSPAVIAELGRFTALTAEDILDKLCTQHSFDFVKDYADQLSLLSLCDFFGLSPTDANNMLAFTGKNYHDMLYWQRLEEYFSKQFITCQLVRRDSLWGKLRELVQSDNFVFENAVNLMKIIWTAGMATTSALISASVHTVLNEPQLADQLSKDERLVAKFIEECLRLKTPLTAIYRITTQPVVLAGQNLPAGTIVLLHLKSAMVDPAHFSDPYVFSVLRPAKRHLAFGAGIHQCIGMGMARAEANSAVSVVLKKLTELKKYNFSEPEYIQIAELHPMVSFALQKEHDKACNQYLI